MRGAQLLATLSQDFLNLQGAAGIRAGQQIRVRGEDVHDLPCTDLVGALRLDQVVDPSAGLRIREVVKDSNRRPHSVKVMIYLWKLGDTASG